MTNQMAKLVLRDADTSQDLRTRVHAFVLTKEDKKRLSEEAEKFEDLATMLTSSIFQATKDFECRLVTRGLIIMPTFHIPYEPDFVISDEEKVLVAEVHTAPTLATDLEAFPIAHVPSTPPRWRLPPELEAFERERQAFLRMKDSLLDNPEYRGRFVAIYRGGIVGRDEDDRELARRVYSEHGYVPIYIGKVERERRVIEMSSPEAV